MLSLSHNSPRNFAAWLRVQFESFNINYIVHIFQIFISMSNQKYRTLVDVCFGYDEVLKVYCYA